MTKILDQNRHQAAALGFPPGSQGLVCNGRVLGPLDPDERFTQDDFSLLERFTVSAHVDKIYTVLTKKADGKHDQSQTNESVNKC